MQQFWLGLLMAICAIFWTLVPDRTASAETIDSIHQPAAPTAQEQSSNESIAEWFKAYDQIRRNAELTLGEKLESINLDLKAKPSKSSASLAKRMISKYSAALTTIKNLQPLPETAELQNGYVQYFSTALEFFDLYLGQPETVIGTDQCSLPSLNSLPELRENLERLDKINKGLDSVLRKKYALPKHRHI